MPSVSEISAQCTGGVWESDARGVGPVRRLQHLGRHHLDGEDASRSPIRAQFAWENLGAADVPAADDAVGLVRWGYVRPVDGGTASRRPGAPPGLPELEAGDGASRALAPADGRAIEKTLAALKPSSSRDLAAQLRADSVPSSSRNPSVTGGQTLRRTGGSALVR
jgi:hypothetical protein